MIEYEPAISHFFEANKTYCKAIEDKLKVINVDCNGYCNSYGYKIETAFSINNLSYKLMFNKTQTTQNGIYIPVDSNEYAGLKLNVSGLNKKVAVTVNESSLYRFFAPKMFKEKIPAPFYLNFNYLPSEAFVDEFVNRIFENKISKFKLRNGKLICKIHTSTTDPLALISNIEKIVKDWV